MAQKPGYATLGVTAIANPVNKDIRLVLWGPLATDISAAAEVSVTVSDTAGNSDTVAIDFPAVTKGEQTLTGFKYSATSVTFGGTVPTLSAPTGR